LVKPTYIFEQTFNHIIKETIESQEIKNTLWDSLNFQEIIALEKLIDDFNFET